jgi:hypothetical protein
MLHVFSSPGMGLLLSVLARALPSCNEKANRRSTLV